MNTTNDDRLKAAAQDGDINLLYTLIEEDPHVLEHIDYVPFVETPLHIAASFGHLQFAAEVMRLKPSFAKKLNPQGFSPIHLAMQMDQKRMVLRFADINKDLVRVKGREGLTPLHFASQTGDVELLASFLSACPDSIEDVNVRNETALHIAVKDKQYEALQVLLGWLKRNHRKDAMKLEKKILNRKDEAGNTILHISALINDLQVLRLLVKSRMNLNAKNLEKSTALDIAENAEIKSILCRAGAKCSSAVTDAPTHANILESNITVVHKIMIYILRIRRNLVEERRNAYQVIVALIVTATFQSALSPPGGVYQANAGDNNVKNIASLNSTTSASQGNAGRSVMSQREFSLFSFLNTSSLFVSTMIMHFLIPSGIIGCLMFVPIYWFSFCYLFSMKVISPTSSSTSYFNWIFLTFFPFVYHMMKMTLVFGKV